MAHELDIITAADGSRVANFVTARKPAWHRLGTVFETEMTVAEALAAANLANWNIRKLDLAGTEVVMDGDGVSVEQIADDDWKLAVRTNPITGKTESFGPVGSGFVHVQNEQHGEFLEALLDQTGARFLTTAGSLKGGRQVFYCAQLPTTMLIGGVDRHDLFVTAMNGHDGSMALSAIASPVRVVCANTQNAAIRRAQQRWAIRHTKGAVNAVQAARKAMEMTFTFNAAFEAEAERMIQATLTAGEFERIVAGLFPIEDADSDRTKRNRIKKLAVIRQLWEAPTQAAIAGTRWAGYNAMTEFVDHFAGARAVGDDAKASARAVAAISGDGVTVKNAAFDAFRVLAKV